MDVTAHLQEVIDRKSQTTIVYHGGSAPGSARRISPIEIKGDTLIARCLESNARKMFKLDKVELATTQEIFPYRPSEDRSAWTFAEHMAAYLPILQAAGWHIEATEDSLNLFLLFKNGRPRKRPEAYIRYEPIAEHETFDWPSRERLVRQEPAKNPWKVSAGSGGVRAFKRLDKAFAAFVSAVESLDA